MGPLGHFCCRALKQVLSMLSVGCVRAPAAISMIEGLRVVSECTDEHQVAIEGALAPYGISDPTVNST